MQIISSAPGKVVLLGEYSVLEGAPALAMAVNRRVQVEVRSKGAGACSVAADPLAPVPAGFHMLEDGSVRWTGSGGARLEVLEPVLKVLARSGWQGVPGDTPVDIRIDSRALFHRRRGGPWLKLGLGSSAAVTAALLPALAGTVAEAPSAAPSAPEAWLPLVLDAHRRFQSGGSGIDVAACVHGGAIAFTLTSGRPTVTPVDLPAEIKTAFVWTGEAASTGELLAGLRAWRDREPHRYSALMDTLGAAAAAGVAAVKRNDGGGFVDAVARFYGLLGELGGRAGLQITSLAHRRLGAMAFECGLVYKPCGAGRGDVGVAMGTEARGITRFLDLVEKSNYRAIDIALHPLGVQTLRSQ